MAKFYLSAFADESASDIQGQIDALKRNRISYLEIRNVDGVSLIDLEPAAISEIEKRLSAEGIRVNSLGSPIGKYPVEEPFGPHFDRFKRALEAAHILNTPRMRIFSFFIPEGHDAHEYTDVVLERLDAMLDLAEKEGVTLCHENEAKIYGRLPAECLELQQKLPRLKAIFDPSNYIKEDVDITPAIDAIAPYLEYIHIKDCCLSDKAIVPAGLGDGKIAEVVTKTDAALGDKVTFATLEPHLKSFTGYSALDDRVMKHRIHFDDRTQAFDAASDAFKTVLTDLGYREKEDLAWTK